MRAAILTSAVRLKQMIVAGDRVVTHLRFRGPFTGHLGQTQGQGQTINFIATDIYRVADERIAENWHVEDNLNLAAATRINPQIGLHAAGGHDFDLLQDLRIQVFERPCFGVQKRLICHRDQSIIAICATLFFLFSFEGSNYRAFNQTSWEERIIGEDEHVQRIRRPRPLWTVQNQNRMETSFLPASLWTA